MGKDWQSPVVTHSDWRKCFQECVVRRWIFQMSWKRAVCVDFIPSLLGDEVSAGPAKHHQVPQGIMKQKLNWSRMDFVQEWMNWEARDEDQLAVGCGRDSPVNIGTWVSALRAPPRQCWLWTPDHWMCFGDRNRGKQALPHLITNHW